MKSASTVGSLDRLDDASDVVLGVGTGGHEQRRGIAILGDQPLLARLVKGGHLCRTRQLQVTRDPPNPPLEAWLVDRRGRGANDDHLGGVSPAPAPLLAKRTN